MKRIAAFILLVLPLATPRLSVATPPALQQPIRLADEIHHWKISAVDKDSRREIEDIVAARNMGEAERIFRSRYPNAVLLISKQID